MWNKICSNKIIDLKLKRQAQRRHLKALTNIKPRINNQQPKQYSFLYSRPKTRQLQQERQFSIESDNEILVKKMMRKTSQYNKQRNISISKDSLNLLDRSRKQREIDQGNHKLFRKLNNTKSIYRNVYKTLNDYNSYKRNMANQRKDNCYRLQTPSNLITKKQSIGRPFSAQN